MKVVLDPLIPPESVETALQGVISAWMLRHVWQPLFDALGEERQNSAPDAPMSAGTPRGGPPTTGVRPADDQDWHLFPAQLNSLNVPRANMPQVTNEDRPAFVDFMEARGFAPRRERLNASLLRPTQAEYSESKLEHIRQTDRGDQAIVVSSRDMRVMDGHHRWLARANCGGDVDAVLLDGSAPEVLAAMWEFPGICRDNALADYPALDSALRNGAVSYADGAFSGRFSAAITKELRAIGAKFSGRNKTYRLAQGRIPYSLRGAVAAAKARAEGAARGLEAAAGSVANAVAAMPELGLALGAIAVELVQSLDRQWAESVKRAVPAEAPGVPRAELVIAVVPDFKQSVVDDVRESLTHNIELSIKGFTADEMAEVRGMAEEMWKQGVRRDQLEAMIRERFEISERRARFLSRQETSMVAAEFARARAEERGSTEYVWHTRLDDRVRPDHEELEGTTQSWDSPPIVDKVRNARAHAGIYFGCRCVARPVLNISNFLKNGRAA